MTGIDVKKFIRDQSLITGREDYKTGGGGGGEGDKFAPTVRGNRKRFSHAERGGGGTTSFEVVLS